LLVKALAFATVIGVCGGLFPAIRAARLSIVSGLRDS
jgi:putative ABC transport system permease protein